jgi:hypothetical protein
MGASSVYMGLQGGIIPVAGTPKPCSSPSMICCRLIPMVMARRTRASLNSGRVLFQAKKVNSRDG